jgi:hypothetical protein
MALLFTRRDALLALGAGAGCAAFGRTGFAFAAATNTATAHAGDWDWLSGSWDVRHRRLRERLVGSTQWEDFGGRSMFRTMLGGLGNVDDNIVDLPAGSYRGLSVRAFDPKAGQWAIWWVDARNPGRIDPPVRGDFANGAGTFTGRDTLRGQPILMRFRWRDLHGPRPWWEQAFSPDDGVTWEINWRNWFTRTSRQPLPLPKQAGAPRDFEFLAGRWAVRHRRLRERLVGSTEWDHFGGRFENFPVLGGYGNVGDNVMEFPSGTVRGIGLRTFDAARGQWSSWWLDGREPSTIQPPVLGGFRDGVGTFIGDDTLAGRPVKTRVLWTRPTPRTARWEQAMSGDGGATWETNWISDFEPAG